jgi:hypothetical protein
MPPIRTTLCNSSYAAKPDFAQALDLLKETLDNPHTFRLYYMQLQNAFLS